MANDKDFLLKNAVEVGGPTKVTLGSITSNVVSFGFSLSNGSYDSVSLSVSSQDTMPQGMTFNTSGTKMYVVGTTNDSVYQYTLSTAFDLSTASYDSVSFSVASQDLTPNGVTFNSNGTKMYIAGDGNNQVYQYSLSTGFDLSTASYDSVSLDISSQDTAPNSVAFNNDGTKMYLSGGSNDNIYQYTLSTGFDLSTASYDSVSFNTTSEGQPQSVTFNIDGTKMYVLTGFGATGIAQYSLPTAFDLSTASYDSVSLAVSTQETERGGMAFSSDGTKVYIVGTTTDTVHQYSTASYADQIDLATGNYFADTLAANTTYTLSNAGGVQSFQLEVTGASTYTITWPSSIEWAGGVAPSAPATGETDVFTFVTDDSGVSYVGLKTADNIT